VATDLDGTLLNHQGEISVVTLHFLQKIQRHGIKIVLASGRMMPRILPYAVQIGGNISVISYNGAKTHEVQPGGIAHLKHNHNLPFELCQEIVAYCARTQLFLNYYCDDQLYGFHSEDNFTAAHFYNEQTLAKYEGLFSNANSLPQKPATKLLVVTAPDNRESLFNQLQLIFGERCSIVKSNPEYLEFIPLGISKGLALNQWLRDQSLEAKNLIAFGDAENDIEMLHVAGLGIGVKNSTAGLKEKHSNLSNYSNTEDVIVKDLLSLCENPELFI